MGVVSTIAAPHHTIKSPLKTHRYLRVWRAWIHIDHFGVGFAVLDVNQQQCDAEHQANAANDDIGDAEEWILATQNGCGGEHHALGAIESGHRVPIVDAQCVVAASQTILEW